MTEPTEEQLQAAREVCPTFRNACGCPSHRHNPDCSTVKRIAKKMAEREAAVYDAGYCTVKKDTILSEGDWGVTKDHKHYVLTHLGSCKNNVVKDTGRCFDCASEAPKHLMVFVELLNL